MYPYIIAALSIIPAYYMQGILDGEDTRFCIALTAIVLFLVIHTVTRDIEIPKVDKPIVTWYTHDARVFVMLSLVLALLKDTNAMIVIPITVLSWLTTYRLVKLIDKIKGE